MAINWPCGQNPGRKPEGRQHASTREAMSPGEQDSTCRASTSYAELATAASGTAREATRQAERGRRSLEPGRVSGSVFPLGRSARVARPLSFSLD